MRVRENSAGHDRSEHAAADEFAHPLDWIAAEQQFLGEGRASYEHEPVPERGLDKVAHRAGVHRQMQGRKHDVVDKNNPGDHQNAGDHREKEIEDCRLAKTDGSEGPPLRKRDVEQNDDDSDPPQDFVSDQSAEPAIGAAPGAKWQKPGAEREQETDNDANGSLSGHEFNSAR